jgi:STAM-binding protein
MVFRPSYLNIHGQQTNNPVRKRNGRSYLPLLLLIIVFEHFQNAQKVLATVGKSKPAAAAPAVQPPALDAALSSSSDEEDNIPSMEPLPVEFKRLMDATKPAKPKSRSKSKKPRRVNPSGLRTIEIDGELFDSFMQAAHRNTIRSIETCGILCGKISRDETKFSVTHLIVPKQTATTDTCATTHEDEIFEYQIKHDLLTLGWIHVRGVMQKGSLLRPEKPLTIFSFPQTHPSQSCFLSSVDLHTQASYQGLFPEAIAIVVAPRDQPKFVFPSPPIRYPTCF